MRLFTIQKITTALAILLIMLSVSVQTNAQCPNNNILYSVDLTPTTVGTAGAVSVTNVYAGEYCYANVCQGATYTFSTCGATYDTQITLYQNTTATTSLGYDDDSGCTTNLSLLTWTATYTGQVNILVDLYSCSSNTTNTPLTVTQITACPATGGCPDNNTYDGGDVTPAFVGDTQTITNAWGGDYYFLDVCEGATYTVSMCGTTWDTQITLYDYPSGAFLLYNDDACAPASEIQFMADYTGTVKIVIDLYNCASNNTNGTLNVTQETGCAGNCSFTNAFEQDLGCVEGDESVLFTPYYTGNCTVDYMMIYTDATGWETVDLTGLGYSSGDDINLFLTFDNTVYTYYYELSDGTTSITYTYTTGTCDVNGCNVTSVFTDALGCEGSAELVDFYVYYTGTCSVYSLWASVNGGTFNELVLAGGFTSGEAIGILLNVDNAEYTYYFELSDGSTSDIYYYYTGSCDPATCTSLSINYTNTGCTASANGQVPSGNITPLYNGPCNVAGVYTSVNGAPFEYLDLSTYNLASGDPIGLLFNIQNADYIVYYILDDGSTSPDVFFTTDMCESGETICDCAGSQLPIEALAWLGDGSLDDGTYSWNGIPVDFNCATWGFDCGDELPIGSIPYDPYGTCSGALPPANGCVDEFCYNIDIDVYTDCYPEEVSVNVFNENNDLVMNVPAGTFTASEALTTINVCLPAGCYTFQIVDSFGDGMDGATCSLIGYFGVYDYSTSAYEVLINGDAYTTQASALYCVGPQTTCNNLAMDVMPGDCYPSNDVLLPSILMDFSFTGNCTVETIYISANGGDFTALDVLANGYNNGDVAPIYYLQPNTDYTFYYATNDGAVSYLYNYTTTDCNNEITICDCDGTQHSIGVTSWLGDGYADNGFYNWAGQPVNFNCVTWGYDCEDIDVANPSDPYDVCLGQLPPFNGCIDTQPTLGCTDPDALNYNPAADINDGSCIYNLSEGCTDQDACNYSETAVVDNGSCEYVTCAGCTNPNANNYDETATIDDGSCTFGNISGCTNPNALNYNPLATTDDGSCILNCVWPSVAYDDHCIQGDLQNFYVDVDLTQLGNGAPYTITNSYNNQQQVMSLMGSVTMGPFPVGVQVVVQVTSNTIDCMLTSQPLTENCSTGGVYGCTDPTALNYNAAATIDDGSCVYVGVDELETSYISMYPNPAKDAITLTNKGASEMVNIRILDAAGRVVVNTQVYFAQGASTPLSVSELAQGNYIVGVIGNGHLEHLPLVIQK